MTLALGEVAALSKTATRGAGYAWGLAEEAAQATRWLCRQDVDGCVALADALARCDGADWAGAPPDLSPSLWQAAGDWLCPISAGAALCDRADQLGKGPLRIDGLASPLLFLGFAGIWASHRGQTVTLAWAGGAATTDGAGLALTGAPPGQGDALDLRPGGDLTQPKALQTRADPTPKALSVLQSFAKRTYAPATEASRRMGAGAGLADND